MSFLTLGTGRRYWEVQRSILITDTETETETDLYHMEYIVSMSAYVMTLCIDYINSV